MEGYPKTPHDPNWDMNERGWDISPVQPYNSGQFQNKGYPEGTWSPWFGFGKADAKEAVKEAKRRMPKVIQPSAGKSRFLRFRHFSIGGIAHFSQRGDVTIKNGFALGHTFSSQKLTGFSLVINQFAAPISLSYRATFDDGSTSGWLSNGQFAGSRNGSPKVTSIAIRLAGAKANLYNVNYRIISQIAGLSKLHSNGAACQAPANSNILAFYLAINEK